jgi:hypothetical protein
LYIFHTLPCTESMSTVDWSVLSLFSNDSSAALNRRSECECWHEKMWKEAVMDYFKVISQHLLGVTESPPPHSGYPVTKPDWNLTPEVGVLRIHHSIKIKVFSIGTCVSKEPASVLKMEAAGSSETLVYIKLHDVTSWKSISLMFAALITSDLITWQWDVH